MLICREGLGIFTKGDVNTELGIRSSPAVFSWLNLGGPDFMLSPAARVPENGHSRVIQLYTRI